MYRYFQYGTESRTQSPGNINKAVTDKRYVNVLRADSEPSVLRAIAKLLLTNVTC